MSATAQKFLSPTLRLVQGHPMEKQDKNMQGQPLVTKTGTPTQRYFCAGAIAKNDPAWPAFFQLLHTAARTSFPHLFNAQGQCSHPRFSWKVIDGDGVDDNGKPNAQKPGFAGNWVVKFQSSYPPRCFYAGRYSPQDQIQDPKVIQRGYFVRVSGSIEGNGDAAKPGLYVNLDMVELSAQGEVINTGPDAGAVFGASAPALPVGATAFGATPAMGAPGMPAMGAPGMPAMPGAQPAMPGMPGGFSAGPAPVAPMAPVAPAALPVMPNPGFAAGPAAMPGMPAMPTPPAAPPAAPAEPQRTAAWPAQFTYAQMLGAGWTEMTMRQAGYIV